MAPRRGRGCARQVCLGRTHVQMDSQYAALLAQLEMLGPRWRDAELKGVPVLARLLELAEQSRTGQAQIVAGFLAGLYDGHTFRMDGRVQARPLRRTTRFVHLMLGQAGKPLGGRTASHYPPPLHH